MFKRIALIPWLIFIVSASEPDVTIGELQGLKAQLMNYKYERAELTSAARSKLIDCIKNDRFDSAKIVINFIDSINHPDKQWLTPIDRFYINAISQKTEFLLDKPNYMVYLDLVDTIPRDNNYRYTYKYLGHGRAGRYYFLRGDETIIREDLHTFLKLSFNETVQKLRNSKNELAYLWEFIDIALPLKPPHPGKLNFISKKYLSRYPSSPFYDLVQYNFVTKYGWTNNGLSFGMGGGYINYGKEMNQVFSDHGAVYMFIDVYVQGLALKFSFTPWTTRIDKSIIISGDTLPYNASVSNLLFNLDLGYLLKFNDRLSLTPYVGMNNSSFSLPKDEKAKLGIDAPLPSLYGLNIGTSCDLRFFKKSDESRNIHSGDISTWGFRFDTGLNINSHKRLRGDFGRYTFYANAGFNIMLFGRKRVY